MSQDSGSNSEYDDSSLIRTCYVLHRMHLGFLGSPQHFIGDTVVNAGTWDMGRVLLSIRRNA